MIARATKGKADPNVARAFLVKGLEEHRKATRKFPMSWIFQGNPNRFDIDDYHSRYTYIYWSTPTNQKEFEKKSIRLSGLLSMTCY